MLVTALLGATFVGMQAFEWTKLITEGVRPWANPWGAPQFGSTFFMITGFHGTHVTIGVIFLLIIARKVWRGDYDRGAPGFFTSRKRQLRERRNHGPLLALRRSRLGVHLRTLLSLVGEIMAQAEAHAGSAAPTAGHEGPATSDQLYLVVWGWLFVLSTFSYLVDYFHFEGYLRWSLILLFMILKAGLIVAIFMHMAWERLALTYAILLPPVLVLVFVAIMVFESDYVLALRTMAFGGS